MNIDLLIDGKSQGARDGHSFDRIDPVTGARTILSRLGSGQLSGLEKQMSEMRVARAGHSSGDRCGGGSGQ